MENKLLEDLDLSVRTLNVLKEEKLESLEDLAKRFLVNGEFQIPKKKIKGAGDVFYHEVREMLGVQGWLPNYVARKPSVRTPRISDRELTSDELDAFVAEPPHWDCLVKNLGFSEDAEEVIEKSMSPRRIIYYLLSVREMARHFLRVKPNGDIYFLEKGHCGKNPHLGKRYTEGVLLRGLPEIKNKLAELGYLK
jgi:hypothetical protein